MERFEEKLNIGKGEKDLFAKWRTDGLSIAEKSDMRLFLQKKVEASVNFPGMMHSFLASFRAMPLRQATSMAVIAVIVIASTGVGVAKASERALPGDVLYVIKTVVNEPVSGLLMWTPEEKAAWARTLSERRMKEADELAVSGKLGEDESKKIETLIEKHHDTLKKYEEEDDDSFARDLDDHSEKLELKIEKKDGMTRYEIRERRHSEDENEDGPDDEEDDSRSDEVFSELEDGKEEGEDRVMKNTEEERRDIRTEEKRSEKKKEDSKSVKKTSKSQPGESSGGSESSSKKESSGSDSDKDDDSGDDSRSESDDDNDDDSDKSGKDEDSNDDKEED